MNIFQVLIIQVFRAGDLHMVEETQFFEVVAVIAQVADEPFVTTGGHAVVWIAGQMKVTVVGHIFRLQEGGVVFEAHFVEELGEAQVAIVSHGQAVHIDGVVYFDMYVLVGVEAVLCFVIVGAVAVEVGRVVTDMHCSEQAHGVAAGCLMQLVGVLDMHQGPFTGRFRCRVSRKEILCEALSHHKDEYYANQNLFQFNILPRLNPYGVFLS